MWLGIKLAARADGRADVTQAKSQLGEAGARQYGALFSKLGDDPDLHIGPDEDIHHHFMRLQTAMGKQLGEAPARPRTQENPFTRKVDLVQPDWLREPAPASAPAQSDLSGLPRRVPGQYTDDSWAQGTIPGYGRPPLAQRTPGAGYSPNYAPVRPTREEWLRGLADKGIYVNPDGTRMTPEQLALPSRKPTLPIGRDIWSEFTQPAAYRGQHRAEARAYVAMVLGKTADAGDDYYQAWLNRQRLLKANGWDLTESGSGNHYHKQIGDQHHFLVPENDGWTHYVSNSPHSYAGSGGNGPYEHVGEAMINAERGPFRNVRFNEKPPPHEGESAVNLEDVHDTAEFTPNRIPGPRQTWSAVNWDAEPHDNHEPCTYCNGSGVDPEYGDDCSRCEGSGCDPDEVED